MRSLMTEEEAVWKNDGGLWCSLRVSKRREMIFEGMGDGFERPRSERLDSLFRFCVVEDGVWMFEARLVVWYAFLCKYFLY